MLEVELYPTRHRAFLSPQRPSQDRRVSGVFANLWGGGRSAFVHGTPTGRPYPPNYLSTTGETRLYPPLCEEEPEVQ